MPLIDSDRLSPTGQRITPPQEAEVAPYPVTLLDASQLNADMEAYVRELAQLRRLVLLKIMQETD